MTDEHLTKILENWKRIEFISYDGKYPCLCFGVLKIKFNGKPYELVNVLSSSGECYIDDGGNEIVTKGKWHVNEYLFELYYPELVPFKEEIEKVVNENVEKGCCGGCL